MRSWRSAARKVSVRQRPCGTLATSRSPRGAAAVGARHVGLGPGLVDEDQAGRVKPGLDAASTGRAGAPRRADPARWRAGFFLKLMPSCSKKCQTAK